MKSRELTHKEWQEVLSRFAAKPEGKTVREFAKEEGVGFNALKYRLYHKPAGPKGGRAGEEIRLVPVELSVRGGGEVRDSSCRWLELETLRGTKVRFVEGTEGKYLADLVSRIAARGI